MKMNQLEKLLVNNPIRTRMIARMARGFLHSQNVSLEGKRVLEVGCGQGAGTEALRRIGGADSVTAFDYDADQLERASRRNGHWRGNGVHLLQADAGRLPFPDDSFDVAVEFAIMHHLPDWKYALREVARVLRPGGWLLYEEYLKGFVAHPVTLRLLDHPEEGWFEAETFYDELRAAGLTLCSGQRRYSEYWLAGMAQLSE